MAVTGAEHRTVASNTGPDASFEMSHCRDLFELGQGRRRLPSMGRRFGQWSDGVRRDAREHAVEPGERATVGMVAVEGPTAVPQNESWQAAARRPKSAVSGAGTKAETSGDETARVPGGRTYDPADLSYYSLMADS